MRIIEQWSLVSAETLGYRDVYESTVEPQGVIVIGLIFNHESKGMGTHKYDDGRIWRTGRLINMPDFNVIHCEDGDYILGEQDPGYMRSQEGNVESLLWQYYRHDTDTDPHIDPIEPDEPTEEELDQNERDNFESEIEGDDSDDWDWEGYCSQYDDPDNLD